MNDDRAWLRQQVAAYRRLQPRYRRYAGTLENVLRCATKELAPLAIVQTRSKSISSFAEKAMRKRLETRDPVRQFTDLCGGRIIARTRSEVDALGEWIKEQFEIDAENSVDTSERLGPTEFGYRSVHYIVSFDPRRTLCVPVDRSLYGLRAEVQLRTLLEHAWADFGHDVSYKGAFKLPRKWERDIALLSAELEDSDHAFSRIEEGLKVYATSYGAYLSEDEIAEEIAVLETVLAHDRSNAELAWRIGKLAMTSESWSKAVDVMAPHVDARRPGSAYQPLLRDLGVSLCKLHEQNPSGRDYKRGQRYLEIAGKPPHRDADALASLAGTWRKRDRKRACELYRQAFELDPTHNYPLTNYIECEVRRTQDLTVVTPLKPTIAAAIERCRAHVEVGINLPWALYGLGKLHLLLGQPYESLREYARAIRATPAAWMLGSVDGLSVVSDELEGYEWARLMLQLGRATKFPTPAARRAIGRLRSQEYGPIEGPVVMVVGGTHRTVEKRMKGYRRLMRDAFRDFHGTIVSGGTTQGISGLVGEVGSRSAGRMRTIGYVPEDVPADGTLDDRYSEIRRMKGERTFTPLQPLQSWIDVVATGIHPSEVKVLGINGGDIAAVEFRVALALGAWVGVLEESGREAARLLADETWTVAENLVPLPNDPETVREFIGSGAAKLPSELREALGRSIHEAHRRDAVADLPGWDGLRDDFKQSSMFQADAILGKLTAIGCRVQTVTEREIALMTFSVDEVEFLAEMEHGRWNAERLAAGWRWGPERDVENKISPYLVPWDDLPEQVREWDRETVRKIPEFLAAAGLEVARS